jgi:hypothetical protein
LTNAAAGCPAHGTAWLTNDATMSREIRRTFHIGLVERRRDLSATSTTVDSTAATPDADRESGQPPGAAIRHRRLTSRPAGGTGRGNMPQMAQIPPGEPADAFAENVPPANVGMGRLELPTPCSQI